MKPTTTPREMIAHLQRENAALKQRILDDNKAYGCELMDPSGTIWDHAKRLQQENAALRRDVYQCPPTSENDYEGFKWNDACEELERENAALRADKERLDWLSSQKDQPWLYWERPLRLTREAIDAFRKEAQP